MEQLADISAREANTAVHLLVQRWAENRGTEVLAAWQVLNRDRSHVLPDWLLRPAEDDAFAAKVSRRVLEAALDGSSNEVKKWATEAIASAKLPRAQVLDLLSLGIIGAILIGMVLAVRVKQVGPVEFYEGLPAGTDKLVKASAAVLGVPSK
jgi:hypothetical protein